MKQNLTMSPKIAYLHEHRKDHFDRAHNRMHDDWYQKAFDDYADELKVVQTAMGTKYFLENKPVIMTEHDILAGCAFRFNYNTTIPFLQYPYEYDPRRRPVYPCDHYKECTQAKEFHGLKPEDKEWKMLDRFSKGLDVWEGRHWETGHVIPSYQKIMNEGWGSVLEACKKSVEAHEGERKEFARAMMICAESAINYIRRYADKARTLAETASTEDNKQWMLKIAEACDHLATEPARNFYEAVQSFWLTHELIYTETFPASVSMGRFDLYMNPYLEKDLADGTLTLDEAEIILDALWVKFSANLHAYQNITLGGLNQDGTYTCNKMTYLTLQTSYKMRYDQPLLNVRWHESMPDELWEDCMLLVKTGMGMPAFHNDNEILKCRMKMGLSEEDAYSYGTVGCVEPTAGDGREYAKTESIRVNWAIILEQMFTGGKGYNPDHDHILPPFHPHNLEDIKTFEEFYDWYKQELLDHTQMYVDAMNLIDASVPYYNPTPLLSTIMRDCIENGMDITGGGCRYNHTGLNATGMAHVVDSLAAIKELVFDKKIVTLTEFAEILDKNYVGYEELKKYVTTTCPKYGNDDDRADLIMKDLLDEYGKLMEKQVNARGGKWQLGLYSVEDHSRMGLRMGALPNGKLKGEALANALSPVQGADKVGPTALINSVLKQDLSIATNNIVLDVKFSPQFLESEKHTLALKHLITAYFLKGGMEIQFNVIDRATLIDAQMHPEKHEDLVVRVSGFSAYFITLMKSTQDEIIARTEYQAI